MEGSKFLITLCLIFIKFISAHPKSPQICTSDECHRQSKLLLSKIDTSVEPCDDFYQFACGNYKNEGSQLLDQLDSIDRWIQKVASEKFNENDDKLLKLIKIFYQSCLNDKGSLNDFIEDGMGMRRRIDTAGQEEVEFTWENAIQGLQFFQNSDAYIFSTKMDFVDEFMLLVVDQPRFETKAGLLDRNNKDVQEFYSNFIDFLVDEGNDRTELLEMQSKAFEFEDKLLELVDDDSEAQVEISTVAELQEVFKFINWTIFMKNFFDGSDLIDENFVIGIKNPEILMKIDKLLFESSNDDIMNYLVWRFIESAYIQVFCTDNDENSVEKRLFGASNSKKSSRTSCLSKLKVHLDVAVAAVYARNVVDQTERKEITDMIKAMKSQLLDNFKSLDWLDSKTKAAAIRKLEAMRFFVGYPDLLLDESFLDAYYYGLDLSKRSLVQIFDQISRFNKQNQRKYLYQLEVHDDVSKEIIFTAISARYVIEPNAAYYFSFNYFLISAGLIYSNTFSLDRPQAMNYGAIGYAIGHEIFHGFDNQGRLYDENGINRNWWEKETEKKFEQKSKCFINQYGSFVEPVTGLKIKGAKTLGENIADNGGLMLAYNTFQNDLKFDQTLPNANFTSNQLLWLSMAQFHCSNPSFKELKYQIDHDEHTPHRFRVFGTLGNLREFSDDFNCPAGSKMNRKNKCKIW